MTDFHIHILPGIDDGAKDSDTSSAMLENLKNQGVTRIIATPHYYPEMQAGQDFLAARNKAFEELDKQGIEFLRGAEVLLSPALANIKNLSEFCVENTKWLLLELPYIPQFSERIFNQIDNLITYRGLYVIIAHIERYAPVRKNFKILDRLREMGCLFQINATLVLSKSFSDKRFLKKLNKNGYIDFIGTDAHNNTSRAPTLAPALDLLRERFGNEIDEHLAYSEAIVFGSERQNDFIIVDE